MYNYKLLVTFQIQMMVHKCSREYIYHHASISVESSSFAHIFLRPFLAYNHKNIFVAGVEGWKKERLHSCNNYHILHTHKTGLKIPLCIDKLLHELSPSEAFFRHLDLQYLYKYLHFYKDHKYRRFYIGTVVLESPHHIHTEEL